MNKSRKILFFIFVSPALLLYAIFSLYPAVMGVASSFTKWDGYSNHKKFIGLFNFKSIIHNEVFWMSFRNNIFLVLVPGVLLLCFSFYFASILRNERLKGRSFFQFTYLFPNIIAGTVVASLWSFVYNPSFGIVRKLIEFLTAILNHIGLAALSNSLNLVELSKQAWLSPQYFIPALVPLIVWGGTGFYVILFLAGMQNIPNELYEAASIDGASEWQVFWHITWPSMSAVTLSAVTFMVISAMSIFDVVWVMTQMSVPLQNNTLSTFIYQRAFIDADMGYGTAAALVLLAVTTTFVLTGQSVFKEKEN